MNKLSDQLWSRRNFFSRMAAVAGATLAPRGMLDHMKASVPGAESKEVLESLPGDASLTFSGIVGKSYPAAQFPKQNYLIDSDHFPSEGNWAFCRFSSEEIPAVRMGFQRGGFNITASDKAPDKSRLQLHLEIMTKDGALLWLPSGRYPAETVITNPESMDIQLQLDHQEIFHIHGWPNMEWSFRSDDGEAEADLHIQVSEVTLLPDCILPQCVFSMWEAAGEVRGMVRYRNKAVSVEGRVFYDHPRIIQRASAAIPRTLYLYTTLYFEDGSSMFGYHAQDDQGRPIKYYCFGVYIDASGRSRFLGDAQLIQLTLGEDKIPKQWQLRWRNKELAIEADIAVRHPQLLRSWGSPAPTGGRTDFPLVLDGRAKIIESRKQTTLSGRGLAEYYNANG